MNLGDYRRKLDEVLLERRRALEDVNRETTALQAIRYELRCLYEGQAIVQNIAQLIQQRVHQRISAVVTRCLNAVFDDPYEFQIRFDRRRGKTEAKMVFCRNGVELEDPLNEVGGGVVDVTALGLRLACVLMDRPVLRRLLILDEPWKNIRGAAYRARTKLMLERLVKDLGLQIIINTDIPEFQLGAVIELGKD